MGVDLEHGANTSGGRRVRIGATGKGGWRREPARGAGQGVDSVRELVHLNVLAHEKEEKRSTSDGPDVSIGVLWRRHRP